VEEDHGSVGDDERTGFPWSREERKTLLEGVERVGDAAGSRWGTILANFGIGGTGNPILKNRSIYPQECRTLTTVKKAGDFQRQMERESIRRGKKKDALLAKEHDRDCFSEECRKHKRHVL